MRILEVGVKYVHVFHLLFPWVGKSTDAEDSKKSVQENLFIAFVIYTHIHAYYSLENILICAAYMMQTVVKMVAATAE